MTTDRTQRLQSFVNWTTTHTTGDEKGQAQIFIDHLFKAFGQPGSLDVGGHPEFRIKPGPEDDRGTSFADYVWKARERPGVLIEMKKRGIDLAKHRQQAFNYWIKLVPNRPQYTVLCNFDEFWIYDFNLDLDEPRDKLTLQQLPDRYGPLAFLFPTNENPTFDNDRIEVTRKAADRLASAFFHMAHVRKIDRGLAQRFILQLLVALFAEDIDLIPKYFVANLLKDIKTPEDSYDSFGGLFEAMNRKGGTPAGRFKPIPYFNGGLFTEPAKLALDDQGIELAHVREAAKENWSKVSPDIFGTLFQHSMDEGERHAFGAHYTAPIDIMKIVHPTIVEPWTTLIDNAKSPKLLADLLERLSLYKVLDPDCGSGNFLYIAYRELKRLESKIRDRLRTEFPTFQATLYHVKASQFYGLDILPFAIELAKVTMMLARKLAIDELHIADEPPLPLDNLDQNFQRQDALLTHLAPGESPGVAAAVMTQWPPADVIIGNPPFLGAKRLKPERGPDYVNALRKLYPEVPGMADYCVYWFRRAHDHLPLCTPDRPESGRAGLVGTQNIRNNQSRVGGLDHIVNGGGGIIIEAVENQPWSGEANVHVSIANWVKTAPHIAPGLPGVTAHTTSDSPSAPQPSKLLAPSRRHDNTPINLAKLLIPPQKKLWHKIDPKLALLTQKNQSRDRKGAVVSSVTTTGKHGKIRQDKSYELDYRETPFINSALSDALDVAQARVLSCNHEPPVVFNGQFARHAGFILDIADAEQLIKKDRRNRKVVHPFLIGRTMLTEGKPDRWVIDFQKMDINEAASFKAPFERIKRMVLPHIAQYAHKEQTATAKSSGQDQTWLNWWWQLFRSRKGLIDRISKLNRYLACAEVTKRPIFCFVDSDIRPDHTLEAFALNDDYSFGILQSHTHWLWFTTKCSKLTERFRYTPDSVFDTFPWPQSPTKNQIDAIAAAGREIRRIRTEALQKITGGLRALYRTLDLPGKNPLKDAHSALDAAVLAAYNFSPTQDLLTQLLSLNLQVAANIDQQELVTAPGVPSTYVDTSLLITDDCIHP